jgi:hypothetical protein
MAGSDQLHPNDEHHHGDNTALNGIDVVDATATTLVDGAALPNIANTPDAPTTTVEQQQQQQPPPPQQDEQDYADDPYSDDDGDERHDGADVELPVTRELTQTDVINVHMLRAFSEYIGNKGVPMAIPPAPEANEDDNDDWE